MSHLSSFILKLCVNFDCDACIPCRIYAFAAARTFACAFRTSNRAWKILLVSFGPIVVLGAGVKIQCNHP